MFLHTREQAWNAFDFSIKVLNSEMWEELNNFLKNNHVGAGTPVDWTPELLASLKDQVERELIDETIDLKLKETGFVRIVSLYDKKILYQSPEIEDKGFHFKQWRENLWGYQPFAYKVSDSTFYGIGYEGIRLHTLFFVGTIFEGRSFEELVNNSLGYRKIAHRVFNALDRSARQLYMKADLNLMNLLEKNNAWAYVYFIELDSLFWISKNVDRSYLYLPQNSINNNFYDYLRDVHGTLYKQYSDLFDKDPYNAFRIDVIVPCGYVKNKVLFSGLYFGGAAAFVILIAGLIGRALHKWALKPMNDIIKIVNELSSQSLDKRIPVEHVDKNISNLISTFNHLLDRLENAFLMQKNYIADTSHELRTPLSVLTFDISEALKHSGDNSAVTEYLKGAQRELGHLTRLVNDLQWLAKNDAGQMSVHKDKIRLDEVFLETVSRCQKFAKSNHVRLDIRATDIVECHGDEQLLLYAFTNLVNNAIKFSSPNNKVELSLLNHNSVARFVVQDFGVGIPENALDRIYDRFYRVDKSRSRETGGSGLGLAIAKQISELHSGSIQVKSIVGKGSTFTIVLPLTE